MCKNIDAVFCLFYDAAALITNERQEWINAEVRCYHSNICAESPVAAQEIFNGALDHLILNRPQNLVLIAEVSLL